MQELGDLSNPQVWQELPEHMRTQETQHLLFKMMSHQAASMHELISVPHLQFPYKLLAVLEDKDKWRAALSSCSSSRDSFSDAFLKGV